MNYRQRLSKQITLPSGATVTISKINAFNIPFLEKGANEGHDAVGVRISRFILLNKVGELEGLKIVETVSNPSCEIAVEELEQADIDFIVAEVLTFSGLTKRDGEARRTFPEAGKENNNHSPSTGEAIPVCATN